MRSRSKRNIIVNAHRKRIRLLKYHSDTLSQKINVHPFKNILSVQRNFAFYTAALYKIIHSVDRL